MKKKTITIIFAVFILANVFLSTRPVSNTQSEFSLVLLQARADGGAETDPPNPPDPEKDPIPFRVFPQDWTLSAIIDYIFN